MLSLSLIYRAAITFHSSLFQTLATANLLLVSMDSPILDISYKWSRIVVWSFVTGFFYLALCFHVVSCIGTTIFLWLNRIPLHGYTIFCVSIHKLIDIKLFPRFSYYEKCFHEYSCTFPHHVEIL